MRTHDEARWQQQAAELDADGEMGKKFRQFVEAWAEEAERLLDAKKAGDPATAIRDALEAVETAHGRTGIFYLGQMLVVLSIHWAHGEAMAKGFSPIELRLIQDVLALKLNQLQQDAANKTKGTDDDKQ